MQSKNSFVIVIVLCLAGLFVNFTAQKADEYTIDLNKKVFYPPFVDLSPALVELVTLGHVGVYHILLNIWGIQYISDEKNYDTQELLDVTQFVMRHKPRFESFYMLPCFVLGVDKKKPEECRPFMDQALEIFPESWRLLMMQGFLSYFKYEEPIKASFYYRRAAMSPKSPKYVISLARKLEKSTNLPLEEIQKVYKDLAEQSEGENAFAGFFEKFANDIDEPDLYKDLDTSTLQRSKEKQRDGVTKPKVEIKGKNADEPKGDDGE